VGFASPPNDGGPPSGAAGGVLSGTYPNPGWAANAASLNFASASSVSWNSDTYLYRDGAANTLAQRNGVNAQTLRIYGTYTDGSNYERLSLGYNGSAYYVGSEAAGTGTGRYTYLVAQGSIGIAIGPIANGVNYWQFNPTTTGSGSVTKYVTGGDANISEYTVTKGTGSHNFTVGGSSGNLAARIDGVTTTPANYAYIRGAATLNAVQYTVGGTDTDIGVTISTKGAGTLRMQGPNGTTLDLTTSIARIYRDGSSASSQFEVLGAAMTSTAILHTRLAPSINQASGTYTVLDINPTETAIGAGPHYLIQGHLGAGAVASVFGIRNTGAMNIAGGLTVGSTTLITSSVAFTNGAAAAAGTLLNAPVAGNPTKWIPVNDNGTTRYIPAW